MCPGALTHSTDSVSLGVMDAGGAPDLLPFTWGEQAFC